MTEYAIGDEVTMVPTRIRLTLFHVRGRAEHLSLDDLDEARRLAIEHLGPVPRLEGSGLFAYAFDRLTGRSLRIVRGCNLPDLFPEAG